MNYPVCSISSALTLAQNTTFPMSDAMLLSNSNFDQCSPGRSNDRGGMLIDSTVQDGNVSIVPFTPAEVFGMCARDCVTGSISKGASAVQSVIDCAKKAFCYLNPFSKGQRKLEGPKICETVQQYEEELQLKGRITLSRKPTGPEGKTETMTEEDNLHASMLEVALQKAIRRERRCKGLHDVPALGSARKVVLEQVEVTRLERLEMASEAFLAKVLHAAIQEGDRDVVSYLISKGASVSTLVEGMSPLYRACKHGNIEVARLLLENHASPTQRNDRNFPRSGHYIHADDYYEFPIHVALKHGNKSLVDLLIRYGFPIDEIDSKGETSLFTAIYEKKEDIALYLIEKGANIHRRTSHGISIMRIAVMRGCFRTVRELVARGVSVRDVVSTHDDKPSLLHYAASPGQPAEMLKYLLDHGAKADINRLDELGWTPLYSAVESSSLDKVKVLVEAGADLSRRYRDGTILEHARISLKSVEEYCASDRCYEGFLSGSRAIVQYLEQVY